jgi:alpha-D-ribose 1-methylphosphonate 5-triphosphate synthase subunit PhnH
MAILNRQNTPYSAVQKSGSTTPAHCLARVRYARKRPVRVLLREAESITNALLLERESESYPDSSATVLAQFSGLSGAPVGLSLWR